MKTISPLQEPQQQSLFDKVMSFMAPTVSPIPGKQQSALGQAIESFAESKRKQIAQAIKNFNPNSAFAVSSTTPTPIPTPTPQVVTPTPTPQPIRINIPASSGVGQTLVPQPATNAIFQAFDPYGEATNAAQVLHHPMQVSGTPQEIARGINGWGNIGENPSFNSTAVNENSAGQGIDTGLFQINSNTFNGMMSNPFWKNALAQRGITSYEQMNDPFKNALTAMLILMRGNFNADQGTMNPNPNYQQWYAAPQALRQ